MLRPVWSAKSGAFIVKSPGHIGVEEGAGNSIRAVGEYAPEAQRRITVALASHRMPAATHRNGA